MFSTTYWSKMLLNFCLVLHEIKHIHPKWCCNDYECTHKRLLYTMFSVVYWSYGSWRCLQVLWLCLCHPVPYPGKCSSTSFHQRRLWIWSFPDCRTPTSLWLGLSEGLSPVPYWTHKHIHKYKILWKANVWLISGCVIFKSCVSSWNWDRGSVKLQCT